MKIVTFSFMMSLVIHGLFFVNFKKNVLQENPNLKLYNGVVSVISIHSNKIKLKNKFSSKDSKKYNKVKNLKKTKFGALSIRNGGHFKIQYPYFSQINGEEGRIIIKIYVDKRGKLEKYKFVLKSKYDRLNNEVIRVIKNVKYDTALSKGHLIPSVGIKEFEFKLKKNINN